MNLSKKSSLRPSNSQTNELNSPDYLSSSPEKSSPEKISGMGDSKYNATSKIFKQAINKYQAHIVEENDDEEENDQIEENTSIMKGKSPFYGTNDGNTPMTPMEPTSMSLSSNSNEKQLMAKARNLERKIPFILNKGFKTSSILNEKEANLLYMNLPGLMVYECELIFSLNKDRSFENLEKVLQSYKCPMVVIVSFGNEKFGGYASESWDLQKARFFRYFSLHYLLFSMKIFKN